MAQGQLPQQLQYVAVVVEGFTASPPVLEESCHRARQGTSVCSEAGSATRLSWFDVSASAPSERALTAAFQAHFSRLARTGREEAHRAQGGAQLNNARTEVSSSAKRTSLNVTASASSKHRGVPNRLAPSSHDVVGNSQVMVLS